MVKEPVRSRETLVPDSVGLSRQIRSAESRSVRRWLERFLVAAIVLAVASAVGVVQLASCPAEVESSGVIPAEHPTGGLCGAKRAAGAYAARFAGIAKHYAATKQ